MLFIYAAIASVCSSVIRCVDVVRDFGVLLGTITCKATLATKRVSNKVHVSISII